MRASQAFNAGSIPVACSNKKNALVAFFFIQKIKRVNRTRRKGFDYKREAGFKNAGEHFANERSEWSVSEIFPLPTSIKKTPLWRFFYWKNQNLGFIVRRPLILSLQ